MVSPRTLSERAAPKRKRAGSKIVYWICWLLIRVFFRLCLRGQVFNRDRLPRTGPVILAANHASFFDPPLIGANCPRLVNYLARDTLFRFPGLSALLHAVNAVPVDREGGGAAGLRAILDRLLAGGAILLFPEGTRTHDGALQPFRSGIGLTVIKSAAPVVPVRIFGTFAAFGRHLRFPRPYRVQIKFGTPLLFQELRNESLNCSKSRLKEIYQEIARQLRQAISDLEPCGDKSTFP